jgi:hypothetical protein
MYCQKHFAFFPRYDIVFDAGREDEQVTCAKTIGSAFSSYFEVPLEYLYDNDALRMVRVEPAQMPE